MRCPNQVLLPQVGAGSVVQLVPQQSLETRLKQVPATTSWLSFLPLLYPASLTSLLLSSRIISGQALLWVTRVMTAHTFGKVPWYLPCEGRDEAGGAAVEIASLLLV